MVTEEYVKSPEMKEVMKVSMTGERTACFEGFVNRKPVVKKVTRTMKTITTGLLKVKIITSQEFEANTGAVLENIHPRSVQKPLETIIPTTVPRK